MTEIGQRNRFVDRGDPAAWDFTVTDFIQDAANHDLDLSAIVPTNAKAVLFKFNMVGSTAGEHIRFKKKGNANYVNAVQHILLVTSQYYNLDWVSPIGPDGKLTYIISANVFTALYFAVKGWWI